MLLTVSRTLPASSPTFSATSSLVAVISRIEELDSSALEVSCSTCCAISRMAEVISRMSREVFLAGGSLQAHAFTRRRPTSFERALGLGQIGVAGGVRRELFVADIDHLLELLGAHVEHLGQLLEILAAAVDDLPELVVDLRDLRARSRRRNRALSTGRAAHGIGQLARGALRRRPRSRWPRRTPRSSKRAHDEQAAAELLVPEIEANGRDDGRRQRNQLKRRQLHGGVDEAAAAYVDRRPECTALRYAGTPDVSSAEILLFVVSMAISLASMPTKRRPRRAATERVVPLPA